MSFLSRRDFLRHAGRLGGAVSAAGVGLVALAQTAGAQSVTTFERGSAASPRPDGAPPADRAAFVAGFRWRMLGPFRGGRCAAATGVPGRPNEFYFGAVNGGVWFSPDAPFGGYKQSGIGREMGVAGFEEYLETKLIAEGVQ